MTVGGMLIEKKIIIMIIFRFLRFFGEKNFKFVIMIPGGMCLWDIIRIAILLIHEKEGFRVLLSSNVNINYRNILLM